MERDAQPDVEKADGDYMHLNNSSVRSLTWHGLTVTVQDRQTKQQKTILSDVSGIVKAGISSKTISFH